MRSVTAVIVAYGDQPWLNRCVDALLASRDVEISVVVVDNGDTDEIPAQLSGRAGVTVYDSGFNLGFAGGCNIGAAMGHGEIVAFVNSDAEVGPVTLARLAEVAARPDVGMATACIRLAEDPTVINSAGNPVHYLGLAWAGRHGERGLAQAENFEVASASGACCAIRRELWTRLGGFDPAYFAYHEDVELSIRCWQRGLAVICVPDAVAFHHYEFTRHDLKLYLLERNRWRTVLTTYSGRSLLLLAPAMITLEVAMMVVAAAQGWLPAKLKGYRWLIANAGPIAARHRQLQGERTQGDPELLQMFSPCFEATTIGRVPGLRALNAGSTLYWRMLRRLA